MSLKTLASKALVDETLKNQTPLEVHHKHLTPCYIQAKNPWLTFFPKFTFEENLELAILLSNIVIKEELLKIELRCAGVIPRFNDETVKKLPLIVQQIVAGPEKTARCEISIQSLYDFNVSSITIVITNALLDNWQVVDLVEGILESHQLEFHFVDARTQFYFKGVSSRTYGNFLEFYSSSIRNLNFADYLAIVYSTIKDVVVNGDNERDLLIEQRLSTKVDALNTSCCPCGLKDEYNDQWLPLHCTFCVFSNFV